MIFGVSSRVVGGCWFIGLVCVSHVHVSVSVSVYVWSLCSCLRQKQEVGIWLSSKCKPKKGWNTSLNHPTSTFQLSGAYLLPWPPNAPLVRALWSLLDGIWRALKTTWAVLVYVDATMFIRTQSNFKVATTWLVSRCQTWLKHVS